MTGENGFNLPKHSELENYAYLLLYKYYIKFLLQSKKKSVLSQNNEEFSIARTLRVYVGVRRKLAKEEKLKLRSRW